MLLEENLSVCTYRASDNPCAHVKSIHLLIGVRVGVMEIIDLLQKCR
jgi:hypothetical protein